MLAHFKTSQSYYWMLAHFKTSQSYYWMLAHFKTSQYYWMLAQQALYLVLLFKISSFSFYI
jgi:hypothetical protein